MKTPNTYSVEAIRILTGAIIALDVLVIVDGLFSQAPLGTMPQACLTENPFFANCFLYYSAALISISLPACAFVFASVGMRRGLELVDETDRFAETRGGCIVNIGAIGITLGLFGFVLLLGYVWGLALAISLSVGTLLIALQSRLVATRESRFEEVSNGDIEDGEDEDEESGPEAEDQVVEGVLEDD